MSSENEIKGIAFTNGLQCVARIKGKDADGFYVVENFLTFEINIDEANKSQNLNFAMPTYFSDGTKGVTAKISPYSIMYFFDLNSQILQNYCTATGTIQIVTGNIK